MQRSEQQNLVLLATTSAAAMIAFQVGGKATRDALFLSNFPVTTLPTMLLAGALASIVTVVVTSHLMSKRGPGRVIPAAFCASSLLLLTQWAINGIAPRFVAVTFYLHLAAFGAILISGFWSIISELFDPRTARAVVGRIVSGSTLGGLAGGLIAERTGAMFSTSAILPVLAILHVICALLNRRLRPYSERPETLNKVESSMASRFGLKVFRKERYLKQLALLITLATICEALLDYVLKGQAVSTLGQGHQLLRFFALFYTVVSLLTFLVQAATSRYLLQQFGLTATMSTLPSMVAVSGVGALIWPGLTSVGLLRGVQSVLSTSLFRSGYELLYSPIPLEDKRPAKTIVDVGFNRLGDALGAGLIRIVLAFGLTAFMNIQLLIVLGILLSILGLGLTWRLSGSYVATLEKSLLTRGADLDLMDVDEKITRITMTQTLGDLEPLRRVAMETKGRESPQPQQVESDLTRALRDFESESTEVVSAALLSRPRLDPFLIMPAIRLLARDDVSENTIKALRNTAPSTVGQLTDALLNPDEDFAVRRRIPRVMAYAPSERAVEGLMRGLEDPRFEVRFSCGRALSRICGIDPALRPHAEKIYSATRREIATARNLVEMPRVLDRYEDQPDASAAGVSWNSTDIRLEHTFRLLALVLPREPLHVAFQALHIDDVYLKGTALEYLESILPSGVREDLLRFLEIPHHERGSRRSSEHIAEDLLNSRHRIDQQISATDRRT